MPFRISVDHVAIFSSCPMRHIWNCDIDVFATKNGNSWKMLLTVITESFVLNVTRLLDPTLKCIYKSRFRQ